MTFCDHTSRINHMRCMKTAAEGALITSPNVKSGTLSTLGLLIPRKDRLLLVTKYTKNIPKKTTLYQKYHGICQKQPGLIIIVRQI